MVRSLPQYLVAISMLRQARGMLDWTCFDGVTRRLAGAWRRAVPMPLVATTPVSVAMLMAILECGLTIEDAPTLCQCASAYLDHVFMNRMESGHYIRRGNLVIVPRDSLGVHQQRSKLTQAAPPRDPLSNHVTLRTPPTR